jgi:hypothetical protein
MADHNNVTKLLAAWISGIQDVENTLQQLLTMRGVDDAIGAQLEVLGRIVGAGREGHTDDVYRRRIRARIAANRSKGTIADVIRVANLVVYDDDATCVVKNQGAAAYVLEVDGIAFAFADSLVLLGLLADATSAGVRVIAESNASPPEDAFCFDGRGFAAFADPSDGGALSSAVSS